MFQQRQLNEIFQVMEVEYGVVNPGAIANGSTVVVTIAPTLGSITGVGPVATCILGDSIFDMITPASAGSMGGLTITGAVTAPGQIKITFSNASGSTVTPVSSVWTFLVVRTNATLF